MYKRQLIPVAGFSLPNSQRKRRFRSFIASSAPLLLLFSSACHGLVETCEELQAAFDLTKTQDVVVEMHPFQDIDCGTFTTMSMDSNTLTVQSSENIENFFGNSDLYQVRFEITNGAKLVWETNVEFHGPEEQDVNGGALFVGEGSNVRFLNDLMMTDVGVRSVPEEDSDFRNVRIKRRMCLHRRLLQGGRGGNVHELRSDGWRREPSWTRRCAVRRRGGFRAV